MFEVNYGTFLRNCSVKIQISIKITFDKVLCVVYRYWVLFSWCFNHCGIKAMVNLHFHKVTFIPCLKELISTWNTCVWSPSPHAGRRWPNNVFLKLRLLVIAKVCLLWLNSILQIRTFLYMLLQKKLKNNPERHSYAKFRIGHLHPVLRYVDTFFRHKISFPHHPRPFQLSYATSERGLV